MVESRKREEDRARARMVTSLVATALELPADRVISRTRRQPEASARAIVYYIMRCAFGMSLGRVGAAMGRDRTTVGAACNRLEDRRDDPRFDRWLAALEQAALLSPLPVHEAEPAA